MNGFSDKEIENAPIVPPETKWIILVGDLYDGYQAHGPYEYKDVFKARHQFYKDTWITQLHEPKEDFWATFEKETI